MIKLQDLLVDKLLNFDPAKLYNDDGSLKKINEIDEDTRMVITGIDLVQIGAENAPVFVRKIRWAQRHQAREQAMKHLAMFSTDNRQKTTDLDPLAQLLKDLSERPRRLPNQGKQEEC